MRVWTWFACGKHPVAADFFHIGRESAMGSSFCRWAQAGFEKAVHKDGKCRPFHSWRFWARGNGRNELFLGLLRDSSDSRGRQYPLIILGFGALTGWTDSWQHLPQACDSVWQSIERISASRMRAISDFEQHLDSIRPPRDLDFLAGQLADRQHDELQHTAQGIALERITSNLIKEDVRPLLTFRISGQAGDEDPLLAMTAAHHELHSALRGRIPHIVFIGGTPRTMLLVCSLRSLTPMDFLWLWSVTDIE